MTTNLLRKRGMPPSILGIFGDRLATPHIKNGTGPPSSLFVSSSIPRPEIKPSDCLVRVHTFGLNRLDTLQREGHYPVPPHASKVLGVEYSGVIEEVGHGEGDEERHKWKKGDEVFGLTYGGAYAEFVAVDKKMIIRKPKELSWEVCGGTCEVWFTALQALHLVGRYSPETTKSVLWHAGASSVSIAGIQLSLTANSHPHGPSELASTSHPAPKVFATARRDEKCDFCVSQLGATGAVNATKNNGQWADEVKKLNDGQGIDLIIDFVGAPYFQQNLDALAMDGRVVTLGAMGGTKLPEGTDMGAFVRKRASFAGSTLRSRSPEYQGTLRDLFEEKVLPGLVDGRFEVKIEKVFDWEKVNEAHELMDSNNTTGKIICKIPW